MLYKIYTCYYMLLHKMLSHMLSHMYHTCYHTCYYTHVIKQNYTCHYMLYMLYKILILYLVVLTDSAFTYDVTCALYNETNI